MTHPWRTLSYLLAALLVTIGLAACGSDGDSSSDGGGGDGADDTGDGGDEGDSGAGDGSTFSGELEDGSTLVVRLDVPADDPAVAPFEDFRTATDAPEVTWIVGEVTVPDGTDGTGRFVTFVAEGADPMDDDPMDPDDGISNADFACSEIDTWMTGVTEADEALMAQYTALYEETCGGQTMQVIAPAGETTTYVMVVEGDLPEFEELRAGLVNELTPA